MKLWFGCVELLVIEIRSWKFSKLERGGEIHDRWAPSCSPNQFSVSPLCPSTCLIGWQVQRGLKIIQQGSCSSPSEFNKLLNHISEHPWFNLSICREPLNISAKSQQLVEWILWVIEPLRRASELVFLLSKCSNFDFFSTLILHPKCAYVCFFPEMAHQKVHVRWL